MALKLTAVLTCFNRRDKTVASLAALFSEPDPRLAEVTAILVDDGSTDDTSAAVRVRFGDRVTVLCGDGSLFWNRGMHLGFAEALRQGADAYLWLNDDTTLASHALRRLLDAHEAAVRMAPNGAIIVGATSDSEGRLTYGGHAASGRAWRPLDFKPVWHADRLAECHAMNGNCVLIPSEVAQRVGNLDPTFEHAMGDTDYALRARALGIRVFVAPGWVGVCEKNSEAGTYRDASLPLRARWARIQDRKGLPWRSWLHFTRRHAGVAWPLYFARPYVQLLWPRGKM